jgi:hypothetical protein
MMTIIFIIIIIIFQPVPGTTHTVK